MNDDEWNSLLDAALDMQKAKKQVVKKKIKVVRTFEYQKAMLYAIQSITGDQTHEIIAKLTEEADKHLEASDVDLSLSPRDNAKCHWGYERRVRTYLYYPGTDIYIGAYILYADTDYEYRNKYDAQLKYNFKLPTSSIKMSQEEYDDYVTDGILCDASKIVEAPELSATLTEEERKIKYEQQKERAKALRIKKRNTKAKSKKLIR